MNGNGLIPGEMEIQLRARRSDLLARIKDEMKRSIRAENRCDPGSGLEECDRAAVSHLDDMRFATMDSNSAMMKQIDLAILRIKEGSYGFCALCGCEIGAERLKIVPAAIYCRECQEELEAGRRAGRPEGHLGVGV
jgi:DnaK suppressor protein